MGELALSVLLGLVQGIAEFLPISSSAHLILVPWMLRVADPGLRFGVALHLGTLAAVLVMFGHEWWTLLRAAVGKGEEKQRQTFWMLFVASIPAGVAGVLLEDVAATLFRAPLLLAGTLAGAGLLLAWADTRMGKKTAYDLGWPGALIVGCAQATALVPGISRSGATMIAGRFLGLNRKEAARFSFLLSVPITLGAALFSLRHMTLGDITVPFLAGIAVAGITGVWAIRFLLRFLERQTFLPFVVYRLALALAIVLLYLSRV